MVTMQNIADDAGVSRGTVSYVLNGRHKELKISKGTVDKVLSVAQRLGYESVDLADVEKQRDRKVVAVITSSGRSFSGELISGIVSEAEKQNMTIKLLPAIGDAQERDASFANALEIAIKSRVDGIIGLYLSEANFALLNMRCKESNIPYIQADNSYSESSSSHISSDDVEGGRLAAELLINSGCKRLVFVTTSLDNYFSRMRFDGYSQAIKKAGLRVEVAHDDCLGYIEKDMWSGYINSLLDDLPDGFFCDSDTTAHRILHCAYKRRIVIPEDVQVVGYGDLPFSDVSVPALTSIRQPFAEMGVQAVQILKNHIDGDAEIQKINLGVELIKRESTGLAVKG